MKFGIAVDSSCDLRDAEEWNGPDIVFTSVPLKLEIGEKEFIDDKSLDTAAFMEEAAAYKGRSGSAAPSPGEWLEAFEAADMTFTFTITASLSGSYNSAEVAKKMAQERHPEKKIFVMNTLSTGPEISLMVRKTAECIKKGMAFEEITAELENYLKSTKLLFILEHMDNLIHNGRVSKLQGSIAGLLGIKILGRASDEGKLDLLHKLRGRYAVYDKCAEEMFARGFRGGRVIIAHCLNPDKAEYLKGLILRRYPQCDIRIMPTGGLCSYYAEKNGVLIGYETE